MKNIQVALVNQNKVIRSGLISLINGWNKTQVICDCSNVLELPKNPVATSVACMIIVELSSQQDETLDEIDQFITTGWNKPILLLCAKTTQRLFRLAEDHSNIHVLSENSPSEHLQHTIYKLAGAKSHIETSNPKRPGKISPRELEFLRLICDPNEFTYEQIAEIMQIHIRTVDSFRKSLFYKLNIKSKTGLVIYAFQNQLVKENS